MKLALLLAALSWSAAPLRVVNPRAPGAPALLRAVKLELPVLGIFRASTGQVVNHFVMGELGVQGHQDALPPQLDRADAGGYTLLPWPDGSYEFRRSGSLQAPITPKVERSLERYFGLRESLGRKLRRWADALVKL